jgi:hypothetical protein
MEIRRTFGLISSGLLGVGFVAMALITLLPAAASKLNRLGYYSVCSYAPVSTVILFILSAVFLLIGYGVFYRASTRPFTSS